MKHMIRLISLLLLLTAPVRAQEIIQTVSSDIMFTWVAVSPDGKLMLTVDDHGQSQLWSVETGALLREFEDDITRSDAVFSPDSRSIFGYNSALGAAIWNVDTGQIVQRWPNYQVSMNEARFSRDGRYVAIATNKAAHVFDVRTGQEVHRLLHPARVLSVSFSPDGVLLATGSIDGKIRVFDRASGKLRNEVATSARHISSLDFVSDTHLLSGGDVSASLWDVQTGKKIKTYPLEWYSPVVRFLGGTHLATMSFDGTVRIWDMNEQKELKTMARMDLSWMPSAVVTDDGALIISTIGDTSTQALRYDLN